MNEKRIELDKLEAQARRLAKAPKDAKVTWSLYRVNDDAPLRLTGAVVAWGVASEQEALNP